MTARSNCYGANRSWYYLGELQLPTDLCRHSLYMLEDKLFSDAAYMCLAIISDV